VKKYDDVPLPGLDYSVEPRAARSSPTRAYSSTLSPTQAAIARFWSRVVRSPDCWIWTGAISGSVSDGDGYGRITWRRDGVSRTMSAHRFALLLAYGDGTANVVAEHRCNEPLCVRVDPEHVISSTQSANLLYAVSLGRAGAHRAPTGRRTRVERSLAVRAALADGWDPIAYAQAAGETRPRDTGRLF